MKDHADTEGVGRKWSVWQYRDKRRKLMSTRREEHLFPPDNQEKRPHAGLGFLSLMSSGNPQAEG